MTVATAQRKGLKKMSKEKNEVVKIDAAKAEKYVANYQNVLTRCNRTAWELAKVVYDTVKAKDFEQAFGTMTEYAKALGVGKSGITKMVKAYERKLYIDGLNNYNEERVISTVFSLGQVEELVRIPEEETVDFLNDYKITSSTKTKVIRECVNAYLSTEITADETTEESADDEMTVDEINESVNLTIETSDGFYFETQNIEIIERVKSFINEIIK